MGSRSQRIPSDVVGLWEEYATWFKSRGINSPRFVVDGRYGVGQFGPDATLHVLVGRIRGAVSAARIHVVCPGASTILRRYAGEPWLTAAAPQSPASLRAVARCHVYVVGGGDLAQLKTSLAGTAAKVSTRVPRVFLAVLVARARGARSCFHSVAFSRPPTGVQRAVARRALQSADVVAARDAVSVKHLKALAERGVVGVENPVLDLEVGSETAAAEAMRYWGAPSDGRPVAVLVFGAGSDTPSRVRSVAACARHLIMDSGYRVVFLPLNHDESQPQSNDLGFARRVRAEVGQSDLLAMIEAAYPPPIVAAMLKQAQVVVSERLEAVMLAEREGVPFVAVSDAEDMREFLQRRGLVERAVPSDRLVDGAGFEWLDQRLVEGSGS